MVISVVYLLTFVLIVSMFSVTSAVRTVRPIYFEQNVNRKVRT